MRQAKIRRQQQRLERQNELQNKQSQRKNKQPEYQKRELELRNISPMTISQAATFKEFNRGKHLALLGCPGVGKSFLALYMALSAYNNGDYEKIIIIRSPRGAMDLGALPGTLEDKIAVFEEPYIAIVNELYDNPHAYQTLKDRKVIQFVCTAFLRGVTFKDAVVIFDEIQNATFIECDTIATRLDDNCKLLALGDERQTDHIKHGGSGFIEFTKILNKMNQVATIKFTPNDIVRSGWVKDYITASLN